MRSEPAGDTRNDDDSDDVAHCDGRGPLDAAVERPSAMRFCSHLHASTSPSRMIGMCHARCRKAACSQSSHFVIQHDASHCLLHQTMRTMACKMPHGGCFDKCQMYDQPNSPDGQVWTQYTQATSKHKPGTCGMQHHNTQQCKGLREET